mgnify:CR=1 FL=1
MKEDKTKIEITNNETGLKLDYDDISPFTGNKCVLIEADEHTNSESRICMETGYTTMDKFKIGSPSIEEYEKNIPQLYLDTKYVDNLLGQIWYLATLRTPIACLYADGTSKDDYTWKLATVKELTLEEREKYPVVDSDPIEYHTHIMDVENAAFYPQNQFIKVMDKFYSILGKQ